MIPQKAYETVLGHVSDFFVNGLKAMDDGRLKNYCGSTLRLHASYDAKITKLYETTILLSPALVSYDIWKDFQDKKNQSQIIVRFQWIDSLGLYIT